MKIWLVSREDEYYGRYDPFEMYDDFEKLRARYPNAPDRDGFFETDYYRLEVAEWETE